MPNLSEAEARRMTFSVGVKLGAPESDAEVLADNLTTASLRGVDSHGVLHVPKYIRRVESGAIVPNVTPEVATDFGAMAVVDGKYNFGQVVGKKAMSIAIEKARKLGIGIVSMRHSDTLGMLAYYSMMALDHDMIGLTMCNTHPAVAPYGGIDPVVGNNSLSVAIPAGKHMPIVLDMATGAVAKNKIVRALESEKQIPVGWAMDSRGQDTTNPEEALRGALLPFGGHKGYGLAVVIASITAGLSDSNCDNNSVSFGLTDSERTNVGQLVAAIDINSFSSVAAFKERVDSMITDIKNSRMRPNFSEIMLPGELEFRTADKRRSEGIPIDEKSWRQVSSALAELEIRQ